MYLLDTMAISEFRKKTINPGFDSWLESVNNNDMFLSVITIGELRKGICLQKKKNPVLAKNLLLWFNDIVDSFSERILPVTNKIAIEWGNISCSVGNTGPDNMIAATAIVHNLDVVTRNIRHFEQTKARCINPWT